MSVCVLNSFDKLTSDTDHYVHFSWTYDFDIKVTDSGFVNCILWKYVEVSCIVVHLC